MSGDQSRVRAVLEGVRAAGRNVLTASEAREVCEAYGLPVPKEGLARSIDEAVRLARDIGFPVSNPGPVNAVGTRMDASWQLRLYSPLRVLKWQAWSEVNMTIVSSSISRLLSASISRPNASSSRLTMP